MHQNVVFIDFDKELIISYKNMRVDLYVCNLYYTQRLLDQQCQTMYPLYPIIHRRRIVDFCSQNSSQIEVHQCRFTRNLRYTKTKIGTSIFSTKCCIFFRGYNKCIGFKC